MPVAALSSVGDMPATLHIAKTIASPLFFSLRGANLAREAHTANMGDTDKNGGPNYLRAWRTFRKMTQEQLADAVDTTVAVISLLESGDRGLSAKWLRRLAPALETTPGYLLDHDPHELPTDVIEIWTHIDKRERPRALRVLEGFAEKTGTDD